MKTNQRNEQGQVLLVGIVMMVILLIMLFILFDLHNILRAKLKVETAQQAAAIAAAEWQKDSLNLIGEINLIKACESLLRTGNQEMSELQPDFDLLTEMQCRVNFLGPLVGLAAAQQTAKANGMAPRGNIDEYLNMLDTDNRYLSKDYPINHYRWRQPYLSLLQSIALQGVAIYPNATISQNGTVTPNELTKNALYIAIRRHAEEIAQADPPTQSAWTTPLASLITRWANFDFSGQWWNIDYTVSDFPNQSEIYTLRVGTESTQDQTGSSQDIASEFTRNHIANLVPKERQFTLEQLNEIDPNWYRYDLRYWDPATHQQSFGKADDTHYKYWFEGIMLRKPLKNQYRYEGPAAYAEGGAEIPRTTGYLHDVRKESPFRRGHYRYGKPAETTLIGSDRTQNKDSEIETDERPGAIAKPFGELDGGRSPIAVELVLPVFTTAALVPTYMPHPYSFGVLRPGYSLLESFLNWLSTQSSLQSGDLPPSGTEEYLEALLLLSDGPGFRYYGYNPNHDAAAFRKQWDGQWENYHKDREDYVYSKRTSNGPGWLQEPRMFYRSANNSQPAHSTGSTQQVPDRINGGEATQYTVGGCATGLKSTRCNGNCIYYIIDSNGKIITNADLDPTRYYYSGGGGSGGDGFGGTTNSPDLSPGPPRL